MGYISIATWRDLTDKHLYHEGEKFPFDGRKVTAARLKELEDGSNRAGLRLIRKAGTEVEQTEGQQEEAPTGATEAQEKASTKPETAARSRRVKEK